MKLLDFSDEVLLHIFTFLKTEDIVSLSQTCDRLNNIVCDSLLVRNTDLKEAFSLTTATLSFFLNSNLRCQNIHTLNLSSCYWLPSLPIYAAAIGLPNLHCLYVQDTQLLFHHLFWILKSNNKITQISWSFNIFDDILHKSPSIRGVQQNSLLDGLANRLKGMEYVNISAKSKSISQLYRFLSYCSNLKELRLNLQSSSYDLGSILNLRPNQLQFRFLQTLILQLQDPNETCTSFAGLIYSACNKTNAWKYIWIDHILHSPQQLLSNNEADHTEFRLAGISALLKSKEVEPVLNSKSLRYLDCSSLSASVKKKIMLLEPVLYNSSITHLGWGAAPLPRILPKNIEHLFIDGSFCETLKRPVYISFSRPMLKLNSASIPLCALIPNNSDNSQGKPILKTNNVGNLIRPSSNNTREQKTKFNSEEQKSCKERNHIDTFYCKKVMNCKSQSNFNITNVSICNECKSKLINCKDTKDGSQKEFKKRDNLPSCSGKNETAMFDKFFKVSEFYRDTDNSDADEDTTLKERKITKKYYIRTNKNDNIQGGMNLSNYTYVKINPCQLIPPEPDIQIVHLNKDFSFPMKFTSPCPFARFAKLTPNLRKLELKNCNSLCNRTASLPDLASLFFITSWKNLSCLILNDVPIPDSRLLVQIGESCCKISHLTLRLINLSLIPISMSHLIEMLTYLKNIQDFRLEYHQKGQMADLLQVMCNSTKLQRIVIMNESLDEPPTLNNIFNLIKECKKLLFLYFNIVSFTQDMVQNFNQQVYERFCDQRPSLWAHIDRNKCTFKEKFPQVHYKEMISKNPKLNIIPPVHEL